jgi:hypothetical protein
MKQIIKYILFTISIISLILASNETIPLKYISGCQIDLDKNGETDLALILESSNGSELIVLMRSEGTYKSYLLFEKCDFMNLSCNYGFDLIETSTGKGKRKERKVKTNGTYLLLSKPESSKIAFYWDNNKFQKIWLAD